MKVRPVVKCGNLRIVNDLPLLTLALLAKILETIFESAEVAA